MDADNLKGWDNLPTTFSDNPENVADNSFVPDKDAETSTGNKDHNGTRRRTTACVTHSDRYLFRRAFSETQLLDIFGIEPPKPGECWHFITAGDVDSLSFLKIMTRHQAVKHVIVSTWCMAAEDILQFDEWLEAGKIEKADFYVGEIFPGSYTVEYRMLNDIIERHRCGRVAVFRNHSKIMSGQGEKFAFTIESSANINTNPRTEQTQVTVNDELYHFYKDYFDGIISIDKKADTK